MVAYWRTRSRSPGSEPTRPGVAGRDGPGPTNTVPGRLAVLRGRAGHAGHGQPDVGSEHPPGARRPWPGPAASDTTGPSGTPRTSNLTSEA